MTDQPSPVPASPGRRLRVAAALIATSCLVVAVALAVSVLTSGVSVWGAGLVAGVVFLGFALWWPERGDPGSMSGLGSGLLGGAVVTVAVLFLQLQQNDRADRQRADAQRQADRQRADAQRQADRQSLEVTLGLRRDLRGINLGGRDLTGFYLRRKLLFEAVFARAILHAANLTRADLTGADFTLADLSGANLSRAHLHTAQLNGATLVKATLFKTDLSRAKLGPTPPPDRPQRTDLAAAILIRADLRGADLAGATLRGAFLNEADLRGATFRGADLSGANFRAIKFKPPGSGRVERFGAARHLSAAHLEGALADGSTQWPDGFDPAAHGVGQHG